MDGKEIEQDTIDDEDMTTSEVLNFLMPSKEILDSSLQFGFSLNQKLFNGWVKQPSPSCAAASVAGAFNALANRHRNDEKSLNHTHVLGVYNVIFTEMIESRKQSYARNLGVKSIDNLLRDIKCEIELMGKVIGGKKADKVTRKSILSAVKKLAVKHKSKMILENQDSNHSVNEMSIDNILPIAVLIEYMESDKIDWTTEDLSDETAVEHELDNDVDIDSEEEDDSDSKDAVLSNEKQQSIAGVNGKGNTSKSVNKLIRKTSLPTRNNSNADISPIVNSMNHILEKSIDLTNAISNPKAKPKKKTTTKFHWLKDLHDIFKKISGLAKLNQEKPSTAAIGNWGILQATRKLSEYHSLGTSIEATLFMGKSKSVKLEHVLSKADSDGAIAAHWDYLRTAFMREDVALIIHHSNHYALIFAIREWIVAEPLIVKTDSGNATSIESSITPNESPTVFVSGALCDLCSPTTSTTSTDGISSLVDNNSQKKTSKFVRQVLTARRGQRPTAWIDFEEIRRVLLGWEGYKIIKCKRSIDEAELRNSIFKLECDYNLDEILLLK